MKKRISLMLAILFCVAMVFASCTSGNTAKEFTADEIAKTVEAAIPNVSGLDNFDLDTMKSFYSTIDTSLVSSSAAKRTTSGTSTDQYGVFVCKSENDAKTFSKQLEEGISVIAKSAAQFGYVPEEQPKLDNAKVVSNGKYVMFAILSDAERTAAITAFNNLFK